MKTTKSMTLASPGVSPLTRALKLSGVYIVIAVVYLILSDRIAMVIAADQRHLSHIETLKGIAFIAITALLFFSHELFQERRHRRNEKLLREADRRSVIGMCSSTIAHDINNLLMALMGLVEGFKGKEQGDEFLSTMRADVETSIERLTRLSKRLAHAGKQHDAQALEEVDLHTQVTNIIDLLRKHHDLRKRNLTVRNGASVSASVDISLFEQALTNLIINSAQATEKGGRIEIAARREDGQAILEVHDDGTGIPTDVVERIFDVGYTTKDNGSGLGMLSVRAFAASCNGEVLIGQSDLGGAAFQI